MRQHVGAEAGLQLGVLVEVVQHDLGDGVALELDDDADADPVAALVVSMSAMPVSLPSRTCSAIDVDEVVVVDLVRQLGDDEAGAAARVLLDLDHAHASGSSRGRCGKRPAIPSATDDQARGREVGPLDALGDARPVLGLVVGLVVLQAPVHGFGDLAQVVRRDVGGHADRDAARAVDQQVREPRSAGPSAPARARRSSADEIDGVLVDVTQHLHRKRRQQRFLVLWLTKPLVMNAWSAVSTRRLYTG